MATGLVAATQPVLVPNLIDQLLAPEHPAGLPGEALQQIELPGSERHGGASEGHGPGCGVDDEVADPPDGVDRDQIPRRLRASLRWAPILASSSARRNGFVT